MSDNQRINGSMYGWSDVYFKVDGERYFGIKSIAYGDSRERGKAYGMGRHYAPRGRTAGKYQVDPVTVSMEKDSARIFRAALAANASDGKSFGSVQFQIVVQYVDDDGNAITDEIQDCVWAKTAGSAEEGPDALYEELEFDAMRIVWNGTSLYDQTEVAP